MVKARQEQRKQRQRDVQQANDEPESTGPISKGSDKGSSKRERPAPAETLQSSLDSEEPIDLDDDSGVSVQDETPQDQIQDIRDGHSILDDVQDDRKTGEDSRHAVLDSRASNDLALSVQDNSFQSSSAQVINIDGDDEDDISDNNGPADPQALDAQGDLILQNDAPADVQNEGTHEYRVTNSVEEDSILEDRPSTCETQDDGIQADIQEHSAPEEGGAVIDCDGPVAIDCDDADIRDGAESDRMVVQYTVEAKNTEPFDADNTDDPSEDVQVLDVEDVYNHKSEQVLRDRSSEEHARPSRDSASSPSANSANGHNQQYGSAQISPRSVSDLSDAVIEIPSMSETGLASMAQPHQTTKSSRSDKNSRRIAQPKSKIHLPQLSIQALEDRSTAVLRPGLGERDLAVVDDDIDPNLHLRKRERDKPSSGPEARDDEFPDSTESSEHEARRIKSKVTVDLVSPLKLGHSPELLYSPFVAGCAQSAAAPKPTVVHASRMSLPPVISDAADQAVEDHRPGSLSD
ncbi:uncharacterized protein BJ171DRAFT_127671 [Polychytrium aggregatum]|uniref:uncharacterized protein n=1 Tax=Polychytrium aggregatum TaxID=110093 RepID=UPI0022FE5CEC|nr:uncharacterized protein BJ171DRAFT_127671 [Polychytrium aggregatum]KAI9204036.1 hypothetical protein BJ171DRAFT_127671 [Polychytrium aggregatum]